MKIKVCGMTQLNQLHQLDEMGVDFAGLIFYPNSPRYVSKHGLKGSEIKKAGLQLHTVGVFVDADYDEVMRTVDAFGLDMVQLHGRETPYECSKIASAVRVIKAFRFMDDDHVTWMLKEYYSCADLFLFDTGVSVPKKGADTTVYGGTGRKFDWNRLKGLDIGKPFLLSGGIAPEDAELVKTFTRDVVAKDLFAVDINSRFETAPGIKNREAVDRFIGAMQQDRIDIQAPDRSRNSLH